MTGIRGSYANGFAPRDGRPLHPELHKGCVGSWSACLGPTGSIIRDWSPYKAHGTVTGATLSSFWAPLSGRYANLYNGSSTYIEVANAAQHNNLTAMSVSMWINVTSFPNNSVFFGKSTGAGSWYIQNFGGALRLYFSDAEKGNFGAISTGVLYHVAFTYDAANVITYVNGVSTGTVAMTGTVSTGLGVTRIGQYVGNGLTVNGYIQEAQLWSRALAFKEIDTLRKRPGIFYDLAPRHRSVLGTSFSAAWARRQSLVIGGGLR